MQIMRHHEQEFPRAGSLRQRMQIPAAPFYSEDPLVRLYSLFGLGMIAAGWIAPHGASWGASGSALVACCYLWGQE